MPYEDKAMTSSTKFLFNTDFSPVKEAPAKISPVDHQTAIAAAEQCGYQRGMTAAEVQARTEAERRTAEAERRTAAACERIADALAAIADKMRAIERRLEAEAVEVAVAVASKLAPALVAREPIAEIEALAAECFTAFLAAPHLVVRVNDELYAAACERLDQIARSHGFEGRLVVLGDADIALGDCRIDWADGGVIRDRVTNSSIADAMVTRY